MEKLNNLLQELGISKVRLAKYLGVSRQMVYNYLELPSISKWPKDKKISLYKLHSRLIMNNFIRFVCIQKKIIFVLKIK